MKQLIILAIISSAIALTPERTSAAAIGGFDVQVGYFYRPLAAYGEWIELDGGLVVWRPMRVRPGWRPYMEGRWAWTDYGWYWVSAEPFGWAVFHYGRWYYDDYYGWIWLPDRVWGPAWVEWRYNDDYLGWAPLPPYASFHIAFGIRFTRGWSAPYHYWNFLPYHRFGSAVRYRDYVEPNYTRRLIGTTRSGNGYEVERDRVVNRGIDRSFIEQRIGQRVERVELRESGVRRGERFIGERGQGAIIETYRPRTEDLERAGSIRNVRRGERRTDLEVGRIGRSGSDDAGTGRPSAGDAPAIAPGTPRGSTTPDRRPEVRIEQPSGRQSPEIRRPTERYRAPSGRQPSTRQQPSVGAPTRRPSSPSPSSRAPERTRRRD